MQYYDGSYILMWRLMTTLESFCIISLSLLFLVFFSDRFRSDFTVFVVAIIFCFV